MGGVFWVLAIIIGLGYGIGLAFLIMALILNKSNNLGDSRSKKEDYASGILYFSQQDRMSPLNNAFMDYVETNLELLVSSRDYRSVKPRSSAMRESLSSVISRARKRKKNSRSLPIRQRRLRLLLLRLLRKSGRKASGPQPEEEIWKHSRRPQVTIPGVTKTRGARHRVRGSNRLLLNLHLHQQTILGADWM